ncbi:MAG: choice-of-anchor tandem repeat GloVer-containing protein [Candidatus Tumulicola sp.]
MKILALGRSALGACASVALLAACSSGGSQLPLSPSPQGLSRQQSHAETAYNILHEFGVSPDDGKNPSADLINVKGTLYGTTVGGGSHIYGTVFKITKTGQETVLHSFGMSGDGANPTARLLNVNGTLYGTTSGGGKGGYYSAGTVFSLTPSGTEKVLHSFTSGSSYYAPNGGLHPNAGLIDVDGTLYGTTQQGGNELSCGTVFSITTSDNFKVLHKFCATNYDGANPAAALLNVDGTLYGTTSGGGTGGHGTVFSITTAGKYRMLYGFGTHDNGNDPLAALINVNGTLYGTTSGSGRGGTVFSITTDGTEKTIFSFNGSDGSQPLAGLVDVKGVLYGTTAMGGAYNRGTVFSVTTSGEETVVHSFHAGGGENPKAGLLDVGGILYGTTYGIVKNNHGNVFSLTP